MEDVSLRVVPPAPEILTERERDLIGSWSRRFLGSHPLTTRFTWHMDGKDVLVGGLGAVMTAPEHHQKSFSSIALREAERIIFDEMNAEIGFLLCLPDLVPFYIRRRWQLIECPVEIDQPTGKVVWPECAMLLPKPGMQFAPKTFDLGGLPF